MHVASPIKVSVKKNERKRKKDSPIGRLHQALPAHLVCVLLALSSWRCRRRLCATGALPVRCRHRPHTLWRRQ